MLLKSSQTITFEDRRSLKERAADRSGTLSDLPAHMMACHPEPSFTVYAHQPPVDAPSWIETDWGFLAAKESGVLQDMTPRAPYLPEPSVVVEAKPEPVAPVKVDPPASDPKPPAKAAGRSEPPPAA